MLSSISVNYALSFYFEKSRQSTTVLRKLLFGLGLMFNIGLLGFYKYLDFFFEIAGNLLNTDPIYMGLILPLGISFFTFQQVSYLIDSYKGNAKQYNLIDYSLFVTFFPQLIAGPIVLHSEIIPQFERKSNLKFNTDHFAKGLFAFSRGLAKKVIIADNFGKIVTFGFSHIPSLNSFESVLAILAYTFQIYFDFSGYCDMASGIAYMFNIELPLNFDSPYKAKTISEFWKRWHITLTRFLTNYIYIPLGGNRRGNLRTYLNILIVFVVSCIWRGAGYTFILWGTMHGIAMVLCRIFKKQIARIPSVIMWACTFIFINLTWVYFRADSVESATMLIQRIFSGGFSLNFELAETLLNIIPISIVANIFEYNNVLAIIMITIILVFTGICVWTPNVQERTKAFTPGFSNLLSTGFLLVWSILSLSGVSTFLYFNF
jgi:D-alanyl-lipoteichoic acid acyltransferase DltB (MBOAT superfamily)